MALTTFGAIMSFAAELVTQAGNRYRDFVSIVKDPGLKGFLEELCVQEKKLYAEILKARRENVTEMILEPVSGLDQETYEMKLGVLEPQEDAEVIKMALIIEERERKFFQEASAKVPLPEVARLFQKVARTKEDKVEKLQSLRLGKTLVDKLSS
jgi:rubrerythrin